MKKAAIFFLVFTFTGIKAHGQEAYKTLTLSIEGNSGVLNKNSGAAYGGPNLVFSGHEVESSIGYGQNFAKAPWLSLYGAFHFFYSNDWIYAMDGSPRYEQTSGDHSFTGHLRVGINFASYFDVQFRSSGLMLFWAGYTFKLPASQSLTLSAEADIWTFRSAARDKWSPSQRILDLFEMKVVYGIAISRGWDFASDLAFRFGTGWNTTDNKTGENYRYDSAKTFGNSFNIRWDNTFTYSYQSFAVWGTLRYDILDISLGKGFVRHNVSLLAGMSYAFNFQKNKE